MTTIVDNEFQSQPCPAIHYTYMDRMEQSSCGELTVLIQNTLDGGVKCWDLKQK